MSNINLPRVPPAKSSPNSGQRRKLLIVAVLVASAVAVGGRAIGRRVLSPPLATPSSR